MKKEPEDIKFEAIVRTQSSAIPLGRINSKKLVPFIGKEVVVIVKTKKVVKCR